MTRLFVDVIRDHRGGKLNDVLTTKLAELVARVKLTGKAGELTLKLKVGPNKGDDEMFEVTPNCKVAMPEPDLAKGLFFATDDGDLLRENPRQRGLFQEAENRGDLGTKPNAGGVQPI